jgi:hypothetical protein
MKYFSPRDLATIRNKTNNNNHTGNLIFISKKIRSPLFPKIMDFNERYERKGYISGNMVSESRFLYEELMKELKMKSPSEFQSVYERL